MKNKGNLGLGLKADQRLTLFGRLRMAEWIEMPEAEFAREIAGVEKDPLFKKLYLGTGSESGAIRRQRWPRGSFGGGGLFEVAERTSASGERVRIEERLGEAAPLMAKIRKLGKDGFERYFLYAEEVLPLSEIARRTGLSPKEIEQINDLMLGIGAEVEFAGPQRAAAPAAGQACLARVSVDGTEPSFEFFSAHWARGRYQIRYDLLEDIKGSGRLEGEELKRLPNLLKRLETINLRQSTVFRILESVTKLQADYLSSRREEKKLPISLRMLAHRLDLAPSTVSRAMSGRFIQLPWGKEARLIELLPGRRRVLRDILTQWIEADPDATDAALTERLLKERGIAISRRTVNAVRAQLGQK